MENKICRLLQIQYPILQGGMAWVANGTLAAAVSEAGGLGIIAAGGANGEQIRREIQSARSLTQKPFGVNIMLLSPFVEEVAEVICQEKIKVVTTGAGSPGKLFDRLKENGVILLPVVPSVAIAKRMEKMGADAVIAEGMEAGGHIGKLTTMALLPQVADAVTIPVIGAGGIGDGRGMAAAFALGASAVQMGTRFIVAAECHAHENYKKMVLKAKDIDTTITGAFTGHPVRALRNPLSREMEKLEDSLTGSREEIVQQFEALGSGALRRAVLEGDTERGSFMAGQIAGMVSKEQSCREILEKVMAEFCQTLGRLSGVAGEVAR